MRRTSRKKARLDRLRRKVLAALVEERGERCQARLDGCDGRAVDGHEVLSRGRGGSTVDGANILLVCRPCHTWITGHPAEAVALGLSAWSWHDSEGEAVEGWT